MNTSINIPKKLKIGFQKRKDTYTGKLAYVIYYDEKNKLRKEQSWKSWCDSKIASVEYDNNPTEGFVLNKKVGGYSSGWNHRNSYIRVYDPRGFEFEITAENLLFILENTNSIKGKGLEGEFVYGWDGKDLVLLPVDSTDYKDIVEISKKTKLSTKELIVGHTYIDKGKNEYIYMGRYLDYGGNYYHLKKEEISKATKSYFFFVNDRLQTYKSINGKFVDCINDSLHIDFDKYQEKMECSTRYSYIDLFKGKKTQKTKEELIKIMDKKYRLVVCDENEKLYEICRSYLSSTKSIQVYDYEGNYKITNFDEFITNHSVYVFSNENILNNGKSFKNF